MLSVRAPFRVPAHAVAPSNPCDTPSASTRSSVCSKSSSLMGTAVQSGPHENSMSQQLPQGHGKSLHPVRAGLRDLVPDPLNLLHHKKDQVQVEGVMLISNRTVLDFDNPVASLVDKNVDLLGLGKIQFQLVSEDLDKNGKPKLTDAAVVKNYAFSDLSPLAGQTKYKVTFKVDPDFGKIGAVVVRNNHLNEFFLHSLCLKLDGGEVVDFFCNSWVNPESYELQFKGIRGINYTPLPDRVFFLNKARLPEDTPPGLKGYREEDLKNLRGNGKGMRVFSDRIYDYDVYNDLGRPESFHPVMRPVLGGDNLPYPRRCRTGRGHSKTKNPARPSDPPSEKEMGSDGIIALGPLVGLLDFYVPCDEFFGGEKTSALLAVGLKSVAHTLVPLIEGLFTGDRTAHFDSIQDFKDLYAKGVKLDTSQEAKDGPLVFVDSLCNAAGDDKRILKFPVPQVFANSDFAWNEDEELGRQTLAGLNPVVIQALTQYPPKSTMNLPEDVYGPNSVLTDEHILPYLEGLSVQEAIDAKKLFIIDYHDPFAVYLPKILKLGDKKKGYAPRAIFFYNKEGAMMPIAIELSKPEGSTFKHTVYTAPLRKGDRNPYWDLAKAHFNSIDFGYHELISHWLRTHAVMEPFVIATRRQLSTMHPIYSLLDPCFKNTMMINAAARVALINATGIIELFFLPGEYSMEMSAVMYGLTWTFEKQALPNDLVSRGMAVPDETQKAGVKLVIDDYPFAEDGLDLWVALHDWITEYVNIAYKSDEAVRGDKELQAWWNEIVTVGHADIKTGWPKADSRASLVDICCTIHWIAGPHHAAVNFGQYSYAGFMPNKPSTCLRWIPEEGTAEAQELEQDTFLFLLKTVATEIIALPIMTTVELLAQHGTDEEYLGDRNELWTSDPQVQQAFKKHSERIEALQSEFEKRNSDSTKRNRSGPAKVPYTLLYPKSGPGLTGRGVPNSISI